MAYLALIFKKMGWEVFGSDQEKTYPPISTLLEKNGISYFKEYNADNLSFIPDLTVVGRSALLVDPNNPEYIKAKTLGGKILSYPEVLEDYLVKNNSIVVSGTFGKSTTTAMISWVLINADLDPSFMFGGIPLNFDEGTRITNSGYSVIEGDETPALNDLDPPKFMFYHPKILLLTATEYDHAEIYKTQRDYVQTYIDLVKLLPKDGLLIYNPSTVDIKVAEACGCRKVTYSTENKEADYFVERAVVNKMETTIDIGGKVELRLQTNFLSGQVVENALRCFVLCKELGLDNETIKNAISSFRGLRTRLELLGEFGGRLLVWDLAQQPSKVKGSLGAMRERYPGNKITVVFNPSATSVKYKENIEKYSNAFSEADQVIVAKVDFQSRVPREERVTGVDLISTIGKSQKNVLYEPVGEKIISFLKEKTSAGDIVLFMSSGGLEFTQLIEKVKLDLGKDNTIIY